MNNTTFGDEGFGYYETVAGGAGAVSFKLKITEKCSLGMFIFDIAIFMHHCRHGNCHFHYFKAYEGSKLQNSSDYTHIQH